MDRGGAHLIPIISSEHPVAKKKHPFEVVADKEENH